MPPRSPRSVPRAPTPPRRTPGGRCSPFGPRWPRPSSDRTPPSPVCSSRSSRAGHILLEGVPGVAKTLLVRTLAAALSVETKRVQFTPDLMPGDLTGSLVFDAADQRLHLPRGTGVHQPAARRRDQPDPAEDPVRPARGDGGAPGERRGPPRTAARRRSSWRPPRTRSSTRAPTRCRRRSSTASCSRWSCRCPPRDDEVTVLRRHASGLRPPRPRRGGYLAGRRPRTTSRPAPRPSPGWRSPTRSPRTSSTSPGPPGTPRRSRSASARAARRRCMATSRAWAWLGGRGYVTPDDVKALAHATLRPPALAPAGGRARGRQRRLGPRQRTRARCPSPR